MTSRSDWLQGFGRALAGETTSSRACSFPTSRSLTFDLPPENSASSSQLISVRLLLRSAPGLFVDPLLVGRDNEIINGAKSATKPPKQLGLDQLPCVPHRAPEPGRTTRAEARGQSSRGKGRVGPRRVEDRVRRVDRDRRAPSKIPGFSPAEDAIISFSAATPLRGWSRGRSEPRFRNCGRQAWRYLPTRSASHRLRRRDRPFCSCSIVGRRCLRPSRLDRRAL